MSALEALNKIRTRAGMPIVTSGISKEDLTDKIRHERKIELAFEDVRYWDLRRWKIAEYFLNSDIHGVSVTKDANNGSLSYSIKIVEKRIFDASKMYLHPIPQTEIDKAQGILIQNPNW